MNKIDAVKLFLLDMDGTVYLDNELLPGAAEAIAYIKSCGREICFLTNNSSRSANDYIAKLARLGIKIAGREIYTSGQAAAEYIAQEYPGKKVYLVGTDKLRGEIASSGIPLTEEMPDIVLLGYDTGLTYNKLVKLTRYLGKGAIFIATHPDINCPAPDVYVPDVGAMLALIEASTGVRPAVICGKPYTPIGEGVRRRFGFRPDEIAMVGDRLSTDVQFGINNGFCSVLVLSGETDREMLKKSGLAPDYVLESIRDLVKENLLRRV